MKNKILLAVGILGLALSVPAQSLPTYKSSTATGSSSAAILFPQGPNTQIRVVSAILTSDLATSSLKLYSGTTAHYVTTAATTSSTNIVLESTNGLTSTSQVYIQATGSNLVLTANSIQSNGLGFASAFATNIPASAEVELLAIGPTLSVGAVTNLFFGSDGLYVGNYGRAVYAVLNGTSACTNNITIHYDGTSQ